MNVAAATRRFNFTQNRKPKTDYSNTQGNKELKAWLDARRGRAAMLGELVWPSSMGYSPLSSRKGFGHIKRGEQEVTQGQLETLRVYMKQVEQQEMFADM